MVQSELCVSRNGVSRNSVALGVTVRESNYTSKGVLNSLAVSALHTRGTVPITSAKVHLIAWLCLPQLTIYMGYCTNKVCHSSYVRSDSSVLIAMNVVARV